jgi:hypothetical protein
VVSDDDGCDPGSFVSFESVAGQTYRIAVDGAGPSQGAFFLFVYVLPPPGNDDFADAFVLSGFHADTDGYNLSATGELGEPEHHGPGFSNPLASVWYEWTAPAPGTVTIDTCGSDFDTTLAVYTGSSVNSLAPVMSDDDGACGDPASEQSAVTFTVTPGTVYRIAVDGAADHEGFIFLTISGPPPTNDNFALAQELVGYTTVNGRNVGDRRAG